MKKHIGVALGLCLSLTLLSVSSVSNAAPQVVGTKCVKAGSFRTAKNVKYQCKKSAQGLRWVKASKPVTPINTTTTTATTTTSTTIPLYSDPEITDVKYLLNLQECQIRDATPMLPSIISSGFPRSSSLRSGFGQLEVLVIPVNFTDLTFGATDAAEQEAAYAKANSFYKAMSYGKAAVKMDLAPSPFWVDTGETVEQNGIINTPPQWDASNFYRKIIEIYFRDKPISGYDVVEVTTAYSTRLAIGTANQAGGGNYGTGKSFAGIQFLGGRPTGRWSGIAHELGHAWLGFEDLYSFNGGNSFGRWDLMSGGPEFSGWSRFLAGWIETNWVRCANPRTATRHYLSALNADMSEDKPRMLVLPLNSQSAIVAELRTPTVWQPDINKPTLLVYRVDTGIQHGNGPITEVGTINQNGGTLTSDGVKITIKGINASGVIVDISN